MASIPLIKINSTKKRVVKSAYAIYNVQRAVDLNILKELTDNPAVQERDSHRKQTDSTFCFHSKTTSQKRTVNQFW